MQLAEYPGWQGVHTREQALGALKNGTRVRKVATEPGDFHPIGSLATVLGSFSAGELGIGYFVAWDAAPHVAVLVGWPKIEQISGADS
jgi:hypothetical protein